MSCNTVRWDELDNAMRQQYTVKCSKYLSHVPLPHSLLLCDDPQCVDQAHKSSIDLMYQAIVDALISASKDITVNLGRSHTQLAGWNDVCAELHSCARNAFLLWVSSGKPRNGPAFTLMSSTRARFK